MDIAAAAAAARSAGRTIITESDGKRILSAFGIAVPAFREVEIEGDVREAVKQLVPPFVLKAVCADIIHKSDLGAVEVNLRDEEALVCAIDRMTETLKSRNLVPERWLVEEMVHGGVECTIGGVMDGEFGPMVMFGLGGIFIELFADVAFRICPIDEIDAHEMIRELRCSAIFHGARGKEPISIKVLVDALIAVGGEDGVMVRCSKEISEIDINPLIANGEGVVAVDARFVLTRGHGV